MAKEIKKEFRYFVLTEYEKEEKYLREMNKKGWKFIKVILPGIYYFEKCEAEDVVYRLDFNPQPKKNVDSYHKMFEDYGWEYLQNLNDYSYFRKPAAALQTDEHADDIFCDNESRMDMLKRVILKKFTPILILFLCAFVPFLCKYAEIFIDEKRSFISGLLRGVSIGFLIYMLFYALLLIRIVSGYFDLTKKYKREI